MWQIIYHTGGCFEFFRIESSGSPTEEEDTNSPYDNFRGIRDMSFGEHELFHYAITICDNLKMFTFDNIRKLEIDRIFWLVDFIKDRKDRSS